MMTVWRKLAALSLVLLTFLLVGWLFVCWLSYSMASFTCMDLPEDLATCIGGMQRQVAIQAAAGVLVWMFAAWLTFRNWGKSE
ncbi:hypothetical protein [Sphingobium yanoikuyae]|jgi:hypothetical protein|uniref:Uncharacterized protein n=1 Tax=Sphingobium yanoikuyae TaxID=13690 RepID=A0A6M4G8B4_SPHYA|nr:hypothetical protein [Sphingobium yanoikuyae]QJR02503.1 hypothetical protein HH800_10105 [Sphingobium yanoikuyae]